VFHIDLEHSFTKAFPGFRPWGRHSPFKIAPGGFVGSRAQLMGAGAAGGGTSAWSAEGVFTLTGTFGKPGTGMWLLGALRME
jgi:hypothetical protein